MGKSCSSVMGEQGALAVLRRGGPIPLAASFRKLGIDIAVGGSKSTGPVLSPRLEAGRSALLRLPPPTSPAMTGGSGPSSRSSTRWRSREWPSRRRRNPTFGGWKPRSRGPCGEPRACPGPRRLSSPSFPRGTVSPRSCTRGTSGSSCWPMWPSGWELPRSSPRLSGNRWASLPGWARWAACSARRPPWAGACARAGGAGRSRGKSNPCTSCTHPSASSDTGSGTAFAAIPRASLRHDARSPSEDGTIGRTAQPGRGLAGRLHRVGDVAAARPHGRGHVDGGRGVGPRHADQFRLPYCGAAHEDKVHVLWD